MSTADPLQLLPGTTIMVVGDLILDHYIRGTTERTSPEAPVPVVLFRGEEQIPGGAANVARNVRAVGAAVRCLGAVGNDANGNALVAALQQEGIECSGIVRSADRPTTTKTRIISQSQQMLRLDHEDCRPISDEAEVQIIQAAVSQLDDVDAVIVSDYNKGVLTLSLLEELTRHASNRDIPLFVDPKGRDYQRYGGAFCLTPNAREASEATGIRTADMEGLQQAAAAIMEMTGTVQLAITRGAEGVALFRKDHAPEFIAAAAREVFDVTGAGDTFIAYLAMATAAGIDAGNAARIANAAAGIVVGKSGAATVSLTELRNAMAPGARARKLRLPGELEQLSRDCRAGKKKVVFTNGCFDFIHVGHVAFFQEARALGDVLVVATNTDEMITKLKGAPRPIIKQEQREKLLAAIESVDYIVPFADETPHALIRALRPDILVKGNNYTTDLVEGHEIVTEYGGKVMLLDVIQNISTNELIRKK